MQFPQEELIDNFSAGSICQLFGSHKIWDISAMQMTPN